MFDSTASYCSPRLQPRPLLHKGYYGLFATEYIPKGEVLVVWSGRLVYIDDVQHLSTLHVSYTIQVEENLYLVSVREGEPADYVNHSCNPNSGLSGQIGLVALRDIQPGEEICFDYAMSDGSPYDEFECRCGEPTCRHRISGNDWQRPELQQRYAGYFSPYLQRRIERLLATNGAHHSNGNGTAVHAVKGSSG